MTTSGPNHPHSYYAATAGTPELYPTYRGAQRCDVCVIGGGLTGLNAALHAAELGHSVILLEARRVGWGASGRNGGQLLSGQRQDQTVLEAEYGAGPAQALWSLAEDAKTRVKRLIQEHAMDVDMAPGHIITAWKPSHARELHQYAEHLEKVYGYTHARYVPRAEVGNYVASALYHGGLYDADAAHLHPLKFTQSLARLAAKARAQIYEDSPALSVAKGRTLTIKTPHGEVTADFLVLACNAYLDGLEPLIAPYAFTIGNYIAATEVLEPARAKALIPSGAAVADTKFVLDYYRLTPDGRLLFGAGETFGNDEPHAIEPLVRPSLERVFPQLTGVRFDYCWGGRLAITVPRLPHVGRIDGNIYFAQGYSGQGLAIAGHVGTLIAEAIHGQSAKFDVYGALKIPKIPGGPWMHRALFHLAFLWFALRDRL
ncbi:MAG TPA: FAD-dependent oxidoreductase [Alphaproteobacteria bacterium]|nr:FAD-dependent oxidoreductase [Alphaproteobacteria bacterium]